MSEASEREALKPCPFCGRIGLNFQEGSTFRWLAYSCAGCGVGNETRLQTMGEGTPAKWRAQGEIDSIKEWNRRSPAPPVEGSMPAGSKEAIRSERRAIVFGDIMAKHIIAMGAAVIEGHLTSPADGLQWIVNTLAGPGNLPDLDEARVLGGAQAWFDAEMAKHEAFRAAHPMPDLPNPKEGDGSGLPPHALPPLPEPDHALDCGALPFDTADQMRAFALAAEPAPPKREPPVGKLFAAAPMYCPACGFQQFGNTPRHPGRDHETCSDCGQTWARQPAPTTPGEKP